jgi:hypothetical protein
MIPGEENKKEEKTVPRQMKRNRLCTACSLLLNCLFRLFRLFQTMSSIAPIQYNTIRMLVCRHQYLFCCIVFVAPVVAVVTEQTAAQNLRPIPLLRSVSWQAPIW